MVWLRGGRNNAMEGDFNWYGFSLFVVWSLIMIGLSLWIPYLIRKKWSKSQATYYYRQYKKCDKRKQDGGQVMSMSKYDKTVVHAIDDVMTAQELLNKTSGALNKLVDNMTPKERSKWQGYSVEQFGYIIHDLLRTKKQRSSTV